MWMDLFLAGMALLPWVAGVGRQPARMPARAHREAFTPLERTEAAPADQFHRAQEF